MEKKIPKVFANKVEKNAGNNKEVFYSSKEVVKESDDRGPKMIKREKNINQKINDIFNSSRYVYKADVEITLKSGIVSKRIVGKNGNNLITIENELIPISDIIDIKHK